MTIDRDMVSEPRVVNRTEPASITGENDRFGVEGYESLAAVLTAAYDQASAGKGSDRHAKGLPFHKQRMQGISELLDTDRGMAYQAIKKITEGLDLPRDQMVREMLGAINYIAGIVIYNEDGR